MLTTFYTDMLTTSLKLPGRVPCLNQSVKPLLTSLWPLTFYSLNTSACREGPLLKTKGISLTFCSLSFSRSLSQVVLSPAQPCNENIPKEFLISTPADIPKLFFFFCLPCPPPSHSPPIPFPPLWRKAQHSGRVCLWIPHSENSVVLWREIVKVGQAELN